MQKNQIILWIVIIVVVVAVGIGVGMHLGQPDDATGASEFSAVYLSTGDVYFGKYSAFPSPHMTKTWYLQRSTDAQNQPQLGVAPLSSVFWGPVDDIKFNQKEIIFSVRLRNDSQVVKVMAAGAAAASPGADNIGAVPQQAVPTTQQSTTTPIQ
jgi:hypothetical protein